LRFEGWAVNTWSHTTVLLNEAVEALVSTRRAATWTPPSGAAGIRGAS
jgi:hypothetical protein